MPNFVEIQGGRYSDTPPCRLWVAPSNVCAIETEIDRNRNGYLTMITIAGGRNLYTTHSVPDLQRMLAEASTSNSAYLDPGRLP